MVPRKYVFDNSISYFTLFFEHFQNLILKDFFQSFQRESRYHMKIAVIQKTSIRNNGMQMGLEI